MLNILIVEGNTADIIDGTRSAGALTAAECYQHALSLHAQEANFHVCVPFAKELSTHGAFSEYDAFALTGSGVSWSAADREAAPYLKQLEEIFAQNKPVIGSCWGMQTVAQLFGGENAANEKGVEIGIAEDIVLTSEGRNHWVFEGVPDRFASPCIHRDHVTQMPDGFEILASNTVSPVQAIASTRSDIDYVGFQFHPEFTVAYIEEIVTRRSISLFDPSMIANFEGKSVKACDDENLRTRVFANWIKHVGNKKAATHSEAA